MSTSPRDAAQLYNLDLHANHAALLAASAISAEVAEGRGYFTETKREQVEALGFKGGQALVPALVIPTHDVHGRLVTHQLRPDQPRRVNGYVHGLSTDDQNEKRHAS